MVGMKFKTYPGDLKSAIHYDPETGVLFRKSDGGLPYVRYGYQTIVLDKVSYRVHRLAWAYMTGEWPDAMLDHRDLDGTNNRWSNLRLATSYLNQMNKKKSRKNTSGFKGVRQLKGGLWVARIKHAGKTLHLGKYETAEAASDAYFAEAQRLAGEFARRD